MNTECGKSLHLQKIRGHDFAEMRSTMGDGAKARLHQLTGTHFSTTISANARYPVDRPDK
jgi:hypothetical protein